MNVYNIIAFACGCIYIIVTYILGCTKKGKSRNKDRERLFQIIWYLTFLAIGYMIYYVFTLRKTRVLICYPQLTNLLFLYLMWKIVDLLYKWVFVGFKNKDKDSNQYLSNCDKNWCNFVATVEVVISGYIIRRCSGETFGIEMADIVITLFISSYISINDIWANKTFHAILNRLRKEFSKESIKFYVVSILSIVIFSIIVSFSFVEELRQKLNSIIVAFCMGVLVIAVFAIVMNLIKSQRYTGQS